MAAVLRCSDVVKSISHSVLWSCCSTASACKKSCVNSLWSYIFEEPDLSIIPGVRVDAGISSESGQVKTR